MRATILIARPCTAGLGRTGARAVDVREPGAGCGLSRPHGDPRRRRDILCVRHADEARRRLDQHPGRKLQRPRPLALPRRRDAGKAALGVGNAGLLGAARPARRQALRHVSVGEAERLRRHAWHVPRRCDIRIAGRTVRRHRPPAQMRPRLRQHRPDGVRRLRRPASICSTGAPGSSRSGSRNSARTGCRSSAAANPSRSSGQTGVQGAFPVLSKVRGSCATTASIICSTPATIVAVPRPITR